MTKDIYFNDKAYWESQWDISLHSWQWRHIKHIERFGEILVYMIIELTMTRDIYFNDKAYCDCQWNKLYSTWDISFHIEKN